MGESGGPGAWRGAPGDLHLSPQGCKERVQTWLAGNLVTIVGVCIGIGLGEVGRMPWGRGLGVVGRLWDRRADGLGSSWGAREGSGDGPWGARGLVGIQGGRDGGSGIREGQRCGWVRGG